jgi:hypothetical protein
MTAIRLLTAILAADVAGYSRLMGADEEGTHERLPSAMLIACRFERSCRRSFQGQFAFSGAEEAAA